VQLSIIGQIIDNQYDNIELDQYTIMPKHIHGILPSIIMTKREDARSSPMQLPITHKSGRGIIVC